MDFLSSEQTRNAPERVGPKARRLADARSRGFPVPEFVVLLCADGPDGPWGPGGRDRLASVLRSLPAEAYAVRSCARAEDGTSTQAGKYRTRLAVPPSEVAAAVEDVWRDARARGAGAGFSVILQRHVRADRAGVAFTRHPLGHPHVAVEWVDGPGAALVGGTAAPSRATFLRREIPSDGPVPPDGVEWFLRAEKLFGHPQDIEWALEKGVFWFLQSRPISTLSVPAAEGLSRLESDLPAGPFLFEKTDLTEAAPRPSPVTWELLRRVYSAGGPVARAYRRMGVDYRDTDFLRRIGGDLYVDRDGEIASLFPCLTVLAGPGIGWRSFAGGGRALRNAFRLRQISSDPAAPVAALRAALNAPPATDVSGAVERFLADYEAVFEVNLRAARALAAAEKKRGRPLTPADWVAAELPGGPWVAPPSLEGNSLEITDTAPFRSATFKPGVGATNDAPGVWAASLWARWREVARWVTVRDVSALRVALRVRARDRGWDDPDLSFFGSLAGDDALAECQSRRAAHRECAEFIGPARLSPTVGESAGRAVGVSAGVSEGVLAEFNHPVAGSRDILWLEDLSVTRAPFLEGARGVLAGRGGVLSHLAILARERGIPVVVDPKAPRRLRPGDRVRLDGASGQVERVDKSR